MKKNVLGFLLLCALAFQPAAADLYHLNDLFIKNHLCLGCQNIIKETALRNQKNIHPIIRTLRPLVIGFYGLLSVGCLALVPFAVKHENNSPYDKLRLERAKSPLEKATIYCQQYKNSIAFSGCSIVSAWLAYLFFKL